MNKDPKASEGFHRVKMAYDRLRSIYEEEEGLRQSREYCERSEQEKRQGRGNTFKSGVNIKGATSENVSLFTFLSTYTYF